MSLKSYLKVYQINNTVVINNDNNEIKFISTKEDEQYICLENNNDYIKAYIINNDDNCYNTLLYYFNITDEDVLPRNILKKYVSTENQEILDILNDNSLNGNDRFLKWFSDTFQITICIHKNNNYTHIKNYNSDYIIHINKKENYYSPLLKNNENLSLNINTLYNKCYKFNRIYDDDLSSPLSPSKPSENVFYENILNGENYVYINFLTKTVDEIFFNYTDLVKKIFLNNNKNDKHLNLIEINIITHKKHKNIKKYKNIKTYENFMVAYDKIKNFDWYNIEILIYNYKNKKLIEDPSKINLYQYNINKFQKDIKSLNFNSLKKYNITLLFTINLDNIEDSISTLQQSKTIIFNNSNDDNNCFKTNILQQIKNNINDYDDEENINEHKKKYRLCFDLENDSIQYLDDVINKSDAEINQTNTDINQTNTEINLIDIGTQTNTEINLIDIGTQTNIEINLIDTDINLIDIGTQTNTEINLIDIGTQINTEINLIDTDINLIDIGTQTNIEINLIDTDINQTNTDINQTNTEINLIDIGTQTNTEINQINTSQTNQTNTQNKLKNNITVHKTYSKKLNMRINSFF